MKMPKIQESKGRFHIAIPYEFIRLCNLKKGNILAASLNEAGVLEFRMVPEQNQRSTGFMKLSKASPLRGNLKRHKK